MARYAISDIHGCRRTFRKALKEINFSIDDKLILIGDYIDRGLDSKGVIQDIIDLQEEGYNIIALKGNHEDFILLAPSNKEIFRSWLYNGGTQTLDSYGFVYDHNEVTPRHLQFTNFVPASHWEWFANLPLIHEEPDYVFCHGALDFYLDNPIADTKEDTILWERIYRIEGNKRREKIGNRILVTGHTPTDKKTMQEMANGEDLITIDRGCYYNKSDYGHLAVFNLDTKQFRFIKNLDRIERD